MSLILEISLLVLLAAVSVLLLARAWRVVRAASERRFLSGSFRSAVDASDGVGISLLCGDVDRRRLENLLGVEYSRYEVVATMDANDDHAGFRSVVDRFRMVRVSPSLSPELPAVGIRALYRSRDRRFRRLILIDKLRTAECDDRNAAVCYSSFDYLLPLPDGCLLMEDAVERLAVAVASCEGGDIAVIRSDVGPGVALYAREAVVAAGGFGSDALSRLPRRRIRTIHEPLVWCPVRSSSLLASGLGLAPRTELGGTVSARRAASWGVGAAVTVAVVAVLVASASIGWWALLSALLTTLLGWSVACHVSAVSGIASSRLEPAEEEPGAMGENLV